VTKLCAGQHTSRGRRFFTSPECRECRALRPIQPPRQWVLGEEGWAWSWPFTIYRDFTLNFIPSVLLHNVQVCQHPPPPKLTVIPWIRIHDFAAPKVTPRTPLVHYLFHSPSSCLCFPYFLHYIF
jgi:hypothetical protein